jgi:hypothetical protein
MFREHKFNIEKSLTPARDSHAFFHIREIFLVYVVNNLFFWFKKRIWRMRIKGSIFATKNKNPLNPSGPLKVSSLFL